MLLDKLFASADLPKRGWPDESGTMGSGWMRTSSGERVDEITSMNLSGVWRCLTVITNDMKRMPWKVYEKQGEKRVHRSDLPIDYILSVETNPETDSATFRETLQVHACLTGNGYAEIERNFYGDPVAMWILDPFKVDPKRDDSGKLIYEYRDDTGKLKVLKPEHVFHLRGLGMDGVKGISIIQNARETIGGGMALEKAGNSFFRNGFRPSGVLEHPTELSDVAFNRLKKDFERQYSGAMNTGKPIIAEGGMKWHQLSISPQDAQYIQSKEFTLSEIARWFGVKQYKLGLQARETHSNIFQNAQEHIDETLHPWAVKWEMEARRKLFKPEDRQRFYTKYDFRGLLRGDHASRTAYYTAMLDRGVYSINDVRALEDENPIENGDARFVPLNTTTLERAISGEGQQKNTTTP